MSQYHKSERYKASGRPQPRKKRGAYTPAKRCVIKDENGTLMQYNKTEKELTANEFSPTIFWSRKSAVSAIYHHSQKAQVAHDGFVIMDI